MTRERYPLCPCCKSNDARTGVRLRAGWERVCRDCANYIRANRARTNAPGVILSSSAAQRAFDDAFSAGLTVEEAMSIAEPVEQAIDRATFRAMVAHNIVMDPRKWFPEMTL